MATFLSEQDKKEIASAIQEAEKNTIGEIRVYIEKHCKEDAVEHAWKLFQKLKMNETAQRTGVLIYIAHLDHTFSIVGDQGINEKVPENFWDEIKDMMMDFFSHGKFAEGISKAVARCGEHLHKHFPAGDVNPNELSNEVVLGEE